MTDYQKLINDLYDKIGQLDFQTEKDKIIALNAQIMDLQQQYRESLGTPPVQFGMEAVDIHHANEIKTLKERARQIALEQDDATGFDNPLRSVAILSAEEKSYVPGVTHVTSPLADKISGQDADKLLKMADDFLAETDSKSTMGAIQQAIAIYKQAEQDKAAFKDEYADILNEKDAKDKIVRESQRTLYGLLAKYALTDVRIIELEGDKEGLVDLDIRNADVLPQGTGFSIKYELMADETNLWKWAVMYAPTLLTVDMKKAEAYIKQLRTWSIGKRTSDWYLPLEMPPAEIVAKILPTVGDVFAEAKEDE